MKTIILLVAIFLYACSHNREDKFDSELSTFSYPFPVKDFYFKGQGQSLKMAYMDIGATDSKKIAILLHGKNFSGFYWKDIANSLKENGYRVIIPDQIGFGKSSKPQNYQYSFYQLAYNTNLLLENLTIEKYKIIGHSMGGMLSIHLAHQYKKASEIILINPIGLEKYLDYVEFKDPQFFYEKEISKTIEDFRNYQIKNYYDGKWNEKYEELIIPFIGQKKGNDYKLIAWNNALTYAPIFNNEIVSLIPAIQVDLHLIIGTRDRTGPGRFWKKKGVNYKLGQYQNLGKEITKLNKRVKLYELEGLGHMPQFEDPKRFFNIFNSLIQK